MAPNVPGRAGVCSNHLHLQLETTRRQIPEGRNLGCRNRLPHRQPTTSVSYRQLWCKVAGWHSVIRNVGHALCLFVVQTWGMWKRHHTVAC